MTDKQFPLVSDDEIMLTQMPHMNLYDDGDFISNILGEYLIFPDLVESILFELSDHQTLDNTRILFPD